jgi:membrane protease subunit HflC
MNKNLLGAVGVGLIVGAIVASSALFTVHQKQQALVLQFGEPKKLFSTEDAVVREPGLHVKLPFVQSVIFYERRILDYDPPTQEIIAADQARLVVDTYTRYRIINPLLFYQKVGTEQGMRNRLDAIVSGALRRVIGRVTLASVLSAERAEIVEEIRDQVNAASSGFGIEVIDVRIRRADLPEQVSEKIYERMQSEREREAREYRAQGAELSQRIKSRADRERTVLLAEAQRDAQFLRGDGDGEAVRIYAEAFSTDPEFFAFYRSMQAYREALSDPDTTMVLSPDSDFFRFFGDITGKLRETTP